VQATRHGQATGGVIDDRSGEVCGPVTSACKDPLAMVRKLAKASAYREESAKLCFCRGVVQAAEASAAVWSRWRWGVQAGQLDEAY